LVNDNVSWLMIMYKKIVYLISNILVFDVKMKIQLSFFIKFSYLKK